MIEITGFGSNEHDAFIDLSARVQALREACLDDICLRPETVLKMLGYKDDVKELERRKQERHQRLLAYMQESIALGGGDDVD